MHVKSLVVIVALAMATAAAAQEWQQFRGIPPRLATVESFDGSFNFCRLMYSSDHGEAGGQGWRTDYPDADINFSIRLGELTRAQVGRLPTGEPNHLVVRLTDDTLFQCPFIIIEDAGTAALSDIEVTRLREYLLKGGFAWVDDFWGTRAWNSWVSQLARVLPLNEYPITDLTPAHAVFRTLFEVNRLPQIPSIQFWRQSGGRTSERGQDSVEPHIRALSDGQGRVLALMTHNTDIADAWEREHEDPRFFFTFSPDGYAVGINVLMYAMTH